MKEKRRDRQIEIEIDRERDKYVENWHDFMKKYSAMPPLIRISFELNELESNEARVERKRY